MRESLELMADLERQYGLLIGRDRLRALLDGWRAFNEAVAEEH